MPPEATGTPAATPSSAPSSTPSSAPGAGSSTPATSTPSVKSPSAYGSIPRSKASQIFDAIDAKADGTAPAADAVPVSTSEAPPAKEDLPVAKPPAGEQQPEAAQPGDEQFPQSIRDALKSIADPKIRKALGDGAFVLRDLSRSGVPYQTIRQFIQDAPAYLSLAPTKDVLESLSQTAQIAHGLGNDYQSGSADGLNRFFGTLVDSNPASFVAFTNHLLSNAPAFADYISNTYGAQTGKAFRQGLDGFFDKGVRNVAMAMKRDSAQEGKEVLGEVADEMLKYLGLDKEPQAPQQPDERDAELQRLQQEVQRANSERMEVLQTHVFNTAGNTLEKSIAAMVDRTGFNSVAKTDIKEEIGKALYNELLTNTHIQQTKEAIDRVGRGDNAHAEALVKLFTTAGERLLPQMATQIIRRWSERVRPELQQRQVRVQQQVQRRDVSASGPPAAIKATGPVKRTQPPGRGAMKEILDAFDTRATNQ